MTTNLRTLVSAYRTLKNAQRPFVLATVVETLGSTYRKAGARMLITEDGEFHGIIGGGCFEGDLLERARRVFAGGHPDLVFYDMRAPEDELWGLGLGCNGAVRLLLERLDAAQGFDPLPIMESCLNRRERGVLATVCARNGVDDAVGRHVFVQDSEGLSRHWPAWLMDGARRVQQTKAPVLAEHRAGRGVVTVFYDWLQSPPHLLIIGAGPDAVPLANLARALDWEVTVVDHRGAYADARRFAAADRVLTTAPEALVERVEIDTVDAAVLMTHNIGYDERFLRALAGTAIGYIGLLGPAARRDRLLSKLGPAAAALRDRVSGPVGLDIGARLPEEIGLAIMAELIAHFRNHQFSTPRAAAHERVIAADGSFNTRFLNTRCV
ncbi:MAG: XdhC family protein [Gammaproteobacteria bacterium]